MKFFAAVVAICALCQAAMAQTPDCKPVSNPGARLASYGKAAPPAASSATATPRRSRAVPVLKTDGGGAKYVDSIAPMRRA